MTNRNHRLAPVLGSAGLAAALMGTFVAGCSKPPPPPPPVVTAPPPPPPPPKPLVTPIDQLMTRYNIDQRVRLPEEMAPDNDDARVAVLQFFDAFARGDASAASAMLSLPDRLQLEQMQADGQWSDVTLDISRVDLRTGQSPLGDPAVLAVFHVGMEFEPQLWTWRFENGQPQFDAEPTPPSILDQLSGDDWITAWYQILADELAKADEPDELVVIPQQNFDSGEDADRPDIGGSAPAGPMGPARSPRRPIREPIDPPPFLPGS